MLAQSPVPDFLPSNFDLDQVMREIEPALPMQVHRQLRELVDTELENATYSNEQYEEKQKELETSVARVKELEDLDAEVSLLVRNVAEHWEAVLELIPKTRRRNDGSLHR